MKRVATCHLIPGMIVADDVYNYNMQLVLPKGTVLSDDVITRLDFYSIINVYVEDAVTASDSNADSVSEQSPSQSYSNRIKATPQFKEFKKKYNYGIENFSNIINDVVKKNTEMNPDLLLDNVMGILDNHYGSVSLLDMLHNMREYNNDTYAHCINVALICNTFAKWLNFSEEDTRTVTLCGLFHDIGKLTVSNDILNKPDKLTDSEYSAIKLHPINGYQLLKDLSMSNVICNAALHHHEKCDGSGYPLGLRSHDIGRFSKMVTIADVYDALTSARIYRGPLCPFRVIEIFEEEGYQKYDTEILLTFLSHIAHTYVSYDAKLSNGMVGEIVFINRQQLSRPMLKCNDEFIDLSKRRELSIESIL